MPYIHSHNYVRSYAHPEVCRVCWLTRCVRHIFAEHSANILYRMCTEKRVRKSGTKQRITNKIPNAFRRKPIRISQIHISFQTRADTDRTDRLSNVYRRAIRTVRQRCFRSFSTKHAAGILCAKFVHGKSIFVASILIRNVFGHYQIGVHAVNSCSFNIPTRKAFGNNRVTNAAV